jgi:hypothetical protein
MQIPILSGVYTGANADYKTQHPVNMMPVVQNNGISEGYLRPVEGIVKIGEGVGPSRGAINWNGKHYRVLGSKLCRITERGAITILGDVGNNDLRVSMDYSFDRLAIASNKNLFYWDESFLTQVTDPDLGDVLDVVWIDGYFMTTDGEFLVVTDIDDPTSVTITKYGSSEIDPDPIVSILKHRNEIYALNRYTIEIFDNVSGGIFDFPFQRINGAQIQRGSIGTHTAVAYEGAIAFIGSGRNEAPGVYMAANAGSVKISTREVDEVLNSFSERQLSLSTMETLNDKGHAFLWIRLPDRTFVYDFTASKAMEEPVWFIMSSSVTGLKAYRGIDVIWCYDAWQVGDSESGNIGVLDNTISSHYGDIITWEFSTKIIYNNSKGALFKYLELVALTGRTAGFSSPTISTSYSLDGRTWSQDRIISVGKSGNRLKRLVWWRQGHMKNNRIQRFRGDSDAYIAVARLEAEIEPLGV